MEPDLSDAAADFGQRLEVAIKQRGLSMAELAREAMLSRWTIMNWLQQRTRPEMAGLRRLARVLHVRAEDLLGMEPDDDVVDTIEQFFSWKSQQQYQEIVTLRRVIDTEVERRLASGIVQRRGRPARAEADQAAAEVVRQTKLPRTHTKRSAS